MKIELNKIPEGTCNISFEVDVQESYINELCVSLNLECEDANGEWLDNRTIYYTNNINEIGILTNVAKGLNELIATK